MTTREKFRVFLHALPEGYESDSSSRTPIPCNLEGLVHAGLGSFSCIVPTWAVGTCLAVVAGLSRLSPRKSLGLQGGTTARTATSQTFLTLQGPPPANPTQSNQPVHSATLTTPNL